MAGSGRSAEPGREIRRDLELAARAMAYLSTTVEDEEGDVEDGSEVVS